MASAAYCLPSKMADPRNIGIFGGTFDPVHLGHLHLASLAQEALALDEIRFLPCKISPHKTGTPPARGPDRLAMLHLATAGIPWAVVDDFELRESGPPYSFETAEAMAARFSDDRLFWIMGGDQWDALPSWKNPERLASCVEFAVLSRGTPLRSRIGYHLHTIPGHHPASATAIREAISVGKSPPWLHKDVMRYIISRNLYRT
jgi:nicotinate-nucleotide adenylyltransferase